MKRNETLKYYQVKNAKQLENVAIEFVPQEITVGQTQAVLDLARKMPNPSIELLDLSKGRYIRFGDDNYLHPMITSHNWTATKRISSSEVIHIDDFIPRNDANRTSPIPKTDMMKHVKKGITKSSNEFPDCAKLTSKLKVQTDLSRVLERIIFNDPATILIFKDGTKEVVKRKQGVRDNKVLAVYAGLVNRLTDCSKRTLSKFMEKQMEEIKIQQTIEGLVMESLSEILNKLDKKRFGADTKKLVDRARICFELLERELGS